MSLDKIYNFVYDLIVDVAELLDGIKEFFRDAADWAESIPFVGDELSAVFSHIADFFFDLSKATYRLTYRWTDFYEWLDALFNEIADIGAQVWTTLTNTWDQFYDMWCDLHDWWMPRVEDELEDLWDMLSGIPENIGTIFSNLKSEWDNFFETTWPEFKAKVNKMAADFTDALALLGQTLTAKITQLTSDFTDALALLGQTLTAKITQLTSDFTDALALLGQVLTGKIDEITADFTTELKLFAHDPYGWLETKFEEVILPWAKENIPLVKTVDFWYETHGDKITSFLEDPYEWVVTTFTDWFLGPEEK